MINATELKENVKKGLKAAYFFKGDDLYLLDFAVDTVKQATVGADNEMAIEAFEDFSRPDEILSVLNMPSFFSEYKLVLVKQAEKVSESLKILLEGYLKNPCPTAVLAVIAEDDSFKSLYKYGEFVNCNRLDAPDVARFAVAEAARNGRKLSPSAARLLAEYSARDLSRVRLELKKLYDFVDGQDISDADVAALVSPDVEFQVYELTNALSRGDNKRVLAVYNALIARGEKGATLLSLIANQYRRVFHTALNADKRDDEIAAYFGVKPYSVKVAREVASKYTQSALKKIVDMLTDLEYSFKSGKMTDFEAIDYAIAYLIKKETIHDR